MQTKAQGDPRNLVWTIPRPWRDLKRLKRSKPLPKQLPLRIRRRRSERPFNVASRFLVVPSAPMQLAKHGIPQIVSRQPRERLNGLEEGKTRLRPLPLGYGDGAVHRVQRRRGDAIEHGVKVGDFFPAGLRERGREGMFGRDASFRMKAREGLSAGRLLQPLRTQTHLILIPQKPVLLFE